MSDWQTLRLDEVADRVSTKNTAGHLRVMTVAAGRGLIDQEDYFTKRVASADLSTYLALEPGDFVYNKSSSKDAPWGVVARNDSGTPAVVTPLYIAFRPRADLVDPDYLLLACNGSAFFDSLRGRLREGARAHGLLNVRLPEFFAAQVTVPALAEQRRIVDLIAAVDSQVIAATEENSHFAALLRARRAELIDDESVAAVKAEDAFEFSTGVRRTPDRATGPSMTPYMRSANVGYGALDLSDVLEMNYEAHEREKFGLRYGDVLVSEGSASAKAVGMPAMWRDDLPGPVCFQMTLLRLRAIEGVCTPEFGFQWCLWAYESRAFLEVASGTNIKHISAKRSSQMPVRLPSLDRQREIATELTSATTLLAAGRAELQQLRTFRSRLLAALLNQDIAIPDSYDFLMSKSLEEVS